MRVIVAGLLAQYPLGGVAWDYFQYVLGLARLGHDVFYFEDTGQWPYNPVEGGVAKDAAYNVRYLDALMARFDLADRWAYRFPWEDQWFGLSDVGREEVVRTADLVINVSGTLCRPWDYRGRARLAYIDSDPGFTQIKLARGQVDFQRMVDAHDVHFSFGETLPGRLPATGHLWHPTRQPVVLSEWGDGPPEREAFTTVMNWTSYKPIEFAGRTYGQKDVELERFLDLPERAAPTVLELAVNEGKTRRTPRELLAHKGWQVVDPARVCPDLEGYRRYVTSSKAEWSVAKGGYVESRCGWFSCRSACYLAAGRPVVVQETGFSDVLPTGEGLLPFATPEEAVDAIRAVEADYGRHSRVAREVAEACFDSDLVLTQLIGQAMAGGAPTESEGGG